MGKFYEARKPCDDFVGYAVGGVWIVGSNEIGRDPNP
jgi:hypothetical protein